MRLPLCDQRLRLRRVARAVGFAKGGGPQRRVLRKADREIARVDAHHHAGVGVALGARILAHAVGDHPTRLGGGGHHRAAGAHTEAVDRAAVLGVMHQLVVGRAEQRVAGVPAPAGLVDHTLRVFNAKAHRERLGLHEHPSVPQQGKGVARAVSQGQHHPLCGHVEVFFGVEPAHAQGLHPLLAIGPGGECDAGELVFKTDLAAQRHDLLAHGLDHLDQFEGADVWVRLVEDFGRRAGVDKLLHHLAANEARVFDLAVELAVGKQACAAFAILHIALRVEHLFAPQTPGVLGALAHRLAALQHNGLEPHLRQGQGGEQATRAQAHHHWAFGLMGRPVGGRDDRWRPAHVGGGDDVRVVGMALQQRGLLTGIGQRHVHDVDRQQIGLARIEAAFEHLQLANSRWVDAQGLCGQAGQRLHGVGRWQAVVVGFGRGVGGAAVFERHLGQRQFEFGDADHGVGLW